MASQLSICLAFFISLLLAVVAFGQQESNALCQYPSARVLDGCPRNTVLVGQNSTSTIFRTIQNAILSLPNDNTSQTILVLPGNYTEQLNVTRKGPITLLGVTRNPRDQAANMVMVNWNSANGAGSGFNDNAYTSVLTVAPNLNASLTGSGNTGFPVPADTPFGNTDFRAYNIDFRNNFAPRAAGPSLAVSISRANAGFYYCGIYSFQVSLLGAVNFCNIHRSSEPYPRVKNISSSFVPCACNTPPILSFLLIVIGNGS